MTPTIQFFCDQHARALGCAEEISVILLSPSEVPKRANDIRLLLARMAGTLKPHFMSEDSFLYPALMASKDPETSKLATQFWDEMGGLTEGVNKFLNSWGKVDEIEKKPKAFSNECQAVFTALKKRIDAEEQKLYPLCTLS